MSKYRSVQGDMWDSIAYKVYGDETKMHKIIEANTKYKSIQVFPAGIELETPELDTEEESTIVESVPVWRE
jgi:phage tail protein X